MAVEFFGADESLRDHAERIEFIHRDVERTPVGTDQRGDHDEAQPLGLAAQFFHAFVLFVDAHPELAGTGSAAADLDFKDAEEDFVGVFLGKKPFHLRFRFGGNGDVQHNALRK